MTEKNPNHMKTKLKYYSFLTISAIIYMFIVSIIIKPISSIGGELQYYLRDHELVELIISFGTLFIALIPFFIIMYIIMYILSKIIDFISK
jgi:hypothetical protein